MKSYKKDLITDILQCLKENEEARERFEGVNYSLNSIKFEPYDNFYEFDEHEKQLFLIHALSSPNGKPICGFLEENKLNDSEYYDGNGEKFNLVNHAKTLRNLYLEQLDNGKSHDEAYKIINKKYNKLNLK